MAKEQAKPAKNLSSKDSKTKAKVTAKPGTLFNILDAAIEKRMNLIFWVAMGLALLFSLLLFDQKVSLTGDDSFYIIRGYDFIHSFKYPAFQGPLYPMVLGLVIAIFGISLIPLKLFSLVAMLAFFYLFYKVLKNRIPASLLVFTMILLSINSYILYYSSQTYNEAFYLFVQMMLVLVFFKYFIDPDQKEGLTSDILRHLLLAACLLAVTMTKNIGFSALLAVFGYFLLKGQWKNLIFAIGAIAAVFLVYQGIKYALWHEKGIQFSTQGSGLLYKDYYNPQNGKEDFAGMIKRVTDNSQLYLSKHFMYMTGFRTYSPTMPLLPIATVFLYILAVTGLIFSYKKNNYLFFTGLLAGAFMFSTFIVLQTKWDQGRLIIPAVAFFILLIFSAIYYAGELKKLRAIQAILPVLAVIIFFLTLATTTAEIKKSKEETGKYGGLTPDWKHYLQASEWAANNLPKDAVIACRKPSISFVYGKGRNFYGIMQLPTYNLEKFYQNWQGNTGKTVAYLYADFSDKAIAPDIVKVLKENMLAQYYVADKFFFVVNYPDSAVNTVPARLKMLGIPGIQSVDSLKSVSARLNKPANVIYPDSLLETLRVNKVDYVLTANLRRNSYEKNGQIINTVERYMAFIEDKYPGFQTKINQIGSDDNEPASIFKLDYSRAGKDLPAK